MSRVVHQTILLVRRPVRGFNNNQQSQSDGATPKRTREKTRYLQDINMAFLGGAYLGYQAHAKEQRRKDESNQQLSASARSLAAETRKLKKRLAQMQHSLDQLDKHDHCHPCASMGMPSNMDGSSPAGSNTCLAADDDDGRGFLARYGDFAGRTKQDATSAGHSHVVVI
ncbi:hypothetical protein AeRB84_007977 [Aphanomyces euteiches]|nr:hypothetical protein AeRB84_007977 [Aphanomyces euteiches]